MSDTHIRQVLIVDDDQTQQRLIARVAERAGFRTAVASCVPQGLELLPDDADFEVAVVDLSLGDRDGLELINRLSELRKRPAIAFVSSFDERIRVASQRYAASLGLLVLGALAKPIDAAGLLSILNTVIPSKKSSQAPMTDDVTPGRLTAAIAAHEIWAAFEPKVSLRTRRIASVETLARWTTPEGERIPPLAFIGVAEQNGIIAALTFEVLDQALATVAAWQRHRPDCTIAVNISPVLLDDTRFPDQIEARLRRYGVSAASVVLEITESVILPNSPRVIESLTRLRIRGFGLSIDDFGTGHSSLLSVMRLPFSELKIDQAFVRCVNTDPDARKIVCATASLARELGLQCVAEGVETAEIEELLRSTTCDMAQGRLYGPSLGAKELIECLARD